MSLLFLYHGSLLSLHCIKYAVECILMMQPADTMRLTAEMIVMIKPF